MGVTVVRLWEWFYGLDHANFLNAFVYLFFFSQISLFSNYTKITQFVCTHNYNNVIKIME